jgi:transglutaminase-like putative cysteine protease
LIVLFMTLGGCGERRYSKLLAKGSDFARDDAIDVTFTYDFDDPRLAALDAKWGLREIAGLGDTQTRALNLLHWLCAHTIKGNPQSLPDDLRMNADSLLDWCFDQPGNDPNCKHLSIILSTCLLAVGIKAYPLWCFPKVYEGDNPVVVQVWLPEESRWIMLDPSFNLYAMDGKGRILDAPEIRKNLAGNVSMRLNEGVTWNGGGYLDYMAKDMYYFYRYQDMRYGILQEKAQVYYLCPTGYNLEDKLAPIYASYISFWK